MKDNVSTSHTPCLYYLLTNVKCMHSILHVLRKKEHNSHEKKGIRISINTAVLHCMVLTTRLIKFCPLVKKM